MTSFYKFLFLSGLLVIFVFALSPGHITPAYIVNHDKMAHVAGFFMLSFLLQGAFPLLIIRARVLVLVLLALMIETMQYLFVGRSFSLDDLLYGVAGILLFVVLSESLKLLLKIFHKKPKRPVT